MLKTFSLDSLMDGYYESYLDFSKLSSKAIKEEQKRSEKIQKLKEQQKIQVRDSQLKVDLKYMKKTERSVTAKVIVSRVFVGCILAALLVGFFLSILVYLKTYIAAGFLYLIIGVSVLYYRFRERFEDYIDYRAWEKIKKTNEYKEELAIAAQEDHQKELIQQKAAKEKLTELMKQPYEYEWLAKEWKKVAQEIRKQARSYGINSLVDSQSDEDLIGVVLKKMDTLATPLNTKGVSYREIMQTGKDKALKDWKECAYYIDKVDNMLKNL